MKTKFTQFSGHKDPSRVYLDIMVETTRRGRMHATCNGRVASIPHPRAIETIERSVESAAIRAFCDFWDKRIPSDTVLIESETVGFEYIASTSQLEPAL